ncbi:hypothetical protein LTR36_002467 [Oleoguttula mirabilis]|uniref:Nucleoprotein TPR/MLP1 domain-containing protein n=1 Tax=Oleoguttula mirabilis TaxID=1507867 RepID=A0AAV9JLW2_9PEZI|nr:hypothetical protein LTR36_002467 [Oleoguttula mirabilis]
MRTRAQAADPMALDLPYLSSTYGVPEADIQTLIDAPTADLVREFLASLTTKGQEIEALKTEKIKVDVELENTVRTSETKVKAQKTQITKHAKEVEELRTKLTEAETARETLASELDELRSSSSGSTAETQALRQRIETLEASNRDALALVESKSTDKDRLATELSEQHSKLLSLRREVSQLEERNQSLENAVSSQKFKEQSLQQEIELLKRNNEWHTNELQTRTQEHAKFRKERNARIASLQRELEDANATVEALKRTETTLRQRLEEVQAKADEAFARVASLQEEAARKEQGFRTELDSTKRLADLQAQNAATHKARLQDIQGQIEQINESAADEIGRLQAEFETERADKEQAERKVAELELSVERLEQQPRPSRQGTPMRNGSFDPATPARLGSRAGSPSAMPGSMRKTVNGLSFTQLYSNYTELQGLFENEKRRTNKLSEQLEELVNAVEQRSPEVLEMRADQDKLEQQVLDFSNMLEDATQTRDDAVKEAQHWQSEASAVAREGDILRQQLRNLSAQVKMLLVEVQSRDQGLDDMSAAERIELERAARGELTGGALEHMTDTGRFIAERLVIFRDVSELQEKNQQMLRLVETLGDRLEGQEAQEKERQTAAYASENEELRQKVQRLQDELQTTVTQIDSYMKERDMFRRMLQHRGQMAPDADMQSLFGQSVPPATPQRNGGMEPPTPRSKDAQDFNTLLKEQQTFFDQYRNESATDRRTLKEQVDALAREKSTLQADIARAQSQLTLASERYEMLQSNFTGLRNENSELTKRSRVLAENAAKQDLRTQQVAEELVEARSMAESLRHENANGKAEKELWKRIEARLTEDNRGLMDERSRLNKLVTDLQNLQNERELADSETRRRLQSRTEALESELADATRKLEREIDDSRKASLRREYEEGQSRTRIDDLVKSLGNVREELVAAKTTRDQLQSRVEEMKIELRSAEEKVVALQPRPTPRAEPQHQQNGEAQVNGETELPVEQRLAVEVSDLRRDLELARNELEAARQQVEQYRSISQSSEEELANFSETSEQYKEDTDRVLAEKDARVKELEQRIEDVSAELTTTNNELSEIRTKHDDSSRALDEQKASFEAELARLRDDTERYTEEKKLFQEDLKAQAEIAQQAQQSYEDELLKHAEAARSLQSVRKEYNELRTEVAGIRAESEAAKASLERGEESWSEQREGFEREFEELRCKREDVDKQNKLLHQQMENFSSELAALRQGRNVPTGDGAEPAGSPSRGDGNLQEVIKFLRREKEIVDVQYELSIQEAKRLQQQLEYANTQLEEIRQKLAEERRQSADKMASEGSTNKLLQTINELNLFRESSTTLREEARQARQKLDEKSKEVERLVAEMEPLKGRVGELEGELESKEGELKLLQDDRDHWRERTQNIISKYDRVDPAELESLKSQLEALKAEKERLEGEQALLREQIDGFEAVKEEAITQGVKHMEDRIERYKVQAKDQNRKQNDRIREVSQELAQLRVEKDAFAKELDALAKELDTLKKELEQTKTMLQEAQAQAEKRGSEEGEEGEVHEDGAQSEEHAALHARTAEAEANASGHAHRVEELNGQIATLQGRVEELEGQAVELNQQLEAAQQDKAQTPDEPSPTADNEALEKAQQELVALQQEVEALRTNANDAASSAKPTVVDAQPAEGDVYTAAHVAEEVAKMRAELEEQHALAKQQVTDECERKLNNQRENLKRQLIEKRQQYQNEGKQELVAQHSTEMQRLKDEYEATITKLKQEHQAELERLAKTGAAAVQKAEGGDGAVKAEQADATPTKAPELSNDQVHDLLQNNARLRTIFHNNLRNKIADETKRLTLVVAEKDAEIASLKEALGSASGDAEKEELRQKLEAAQKEKEAAVRQAVDTVEKKVKVQLSFRDIAQAKLLVIQTAVKETPEKPVREVWEVAAKAKPVPKPAPVSAPPASSPAAKSNVPASPAQGKPPPPQSPLEQTPEQIEQAKLRARQERFGTVPTPAAASASTFGQPSAAPTTTSTFGQPGQQPGALAQPARRPSASVQAGNPPNPQAPTFTPGGTTDSAAPANSAPAAPRGLTGIPHPRGATSLPRGPGAAGRGGLSFQGAATQNAQGQPPRGGLQSALPRGGGNFVGRGGGRGGPSAMPRGNNAGAANAGQKRSHEGSDGGDGKRMRGGGAPGSGA